MILVTPPAPGSRPSVTSGRPSWMDGSSSTMRQCAHQRDLPAAAQRGAFERRDHRDAERLERAHAASSRPRSSGTPSARRSAPNCSTSFSSAPAKKVFFAEARITPLVEAFSFARRSTVSVNAFCQRLGHGVDRRAGRVEGQRDDVFGSFSNLMGMHICDPCSHNGEKNLPAKSQSRSTIVAMPMPPPTHSVARP